MLLHRTLILNPALATYPPSRKTRILLSKRLTSLHAPNLPFTLGPEDLTPNSQQRRPDSPSRLPRFLVVARDAKTYFAVDFESRGGGQEAEGRWAEGVCWGEGDAAVVEAAGVGAWTWWPGECEVPVVEIGFVDGAGGEVGTWVFVEVC